MARLSIFAGPLAISVLFGSPGLACADAQKTPATIYKDSIHGVFTIHAGNIYGTGFVVYPGLLATNAHVVGSATVVEIEAQDGTTFQATVIQKDLAHDYAILKPNGIRPFTTAISLPLGPTPAIGESVVVIGSPGGMKGTVTTGIVSQVYPDGMIQLNVSVNAGNSGGPVFDLQGRVFGIATYKYSRGDGIGFAIPVRWLDASQMGK